MPFQPVPNVAQVRIEGSQDGQLTINDLYFEVSGGGITPVNVLALATAVAAWVVGNFAAPLSNDWAASRVVAFDIGDPAGAIAVAPSVVIGGTATESAPNNVAACLSIRTGLAGRSGHGRNYICGIPNADIDINTMSGTLMADIIENYEMLIGAGTFLAGWQWVVVSRRTLGDVRPAGIAIPVTAVSFTRPTVSSMRSRSVGHGA